MLVAIERSKFNLLFKYNVISVSQTQLIDEKVEIIRKFDEKILKTELDRMLPYFEQGHEILLLDVDKSKIGLKKDIELSFASIRMIYPLTKEAGLLLQGKLNEHLKVGGAIFEEAVNGVIAERNIKNRKDAAKNLVDIFGLKEVMYNSDFVRALNQSIFSFLQISKIDESNFLFYLISYNKTPSFIPEGNAGSFIKIGLVIAQYKKAIEENIKKSPYFIKCVDNLRKLNVQSLFEGYYRFIELLSDDTLNKSYNNLLMQFPDFEGLDLFKISYHYIAIKDYLNQNEQNLLPITQELYIESQKDPINFYHILLLIGYTFSFENLYESLHILNQAPAISSHFKLLTAEVESMESREQREEYIKKTEVKPIENEPKLVVGENIESDSAVNEEGRTTDEKMSGGEKMEKEEVKEIEEVRSAELELSTKIGKPIKFNALLYSITQSKTPKKFDEKTKELWLSLLAEAFSENQDIYWNDILKVIEESSNKKSLEKSKGTIEKFFKSK